MVVLALVLALVVLDDGIETEGARELPAVSVALEVSDAGRSTDIARARETEYRHRVLLLAVVALFEEAAAACCCC